MESRAEAYKNKGTFITYIIWHEWEAKYTTIWDWRHQPGYGHIFKMYNKLGRVEIDFLISPSMRSTMSYSGNKTVIQRPSKMKPLCETWTLNVVQTLCMIEVAKIFHSILFIIFGWTARPRRVGLDDGLERCLKAFSKRFSDQDVCH